MRNSINKLLIVTGLTFMVYLYACKKNNVETPVVPTVSKIDTLFGTFGDKITITGSGFSSVLSDNVVSFNNVVTEVLEASPDRLLVTVPKQAESGDIQVAQNGSLPSKGIYFNIIKPGTPVITKIDPANGSEAGKIITITGVGFSTDFNKNAVTINTVAAKILNATATSLAVQVPGKATTGFVRVTTNSFTSPPFPYTIKPLNILEDGRFYLTNTFQVAKANDINGFPGSTSIYKFPGGNTTLDTKIFDIDENKNELYGRTTSYTANKGNGKCDIVKINTKGDISRQVLYQSYTTGLLFTDPSGNGYYNDNSTAIAVDSRTGALYVSYLNVSAGKYQIYKAGTGGGIFPFTPVYSTASKITEIFVSLTRLFFTDGIRLNSTDLNGNDFRDHSGKLPNSSLAGTSASAIIYIAVNKETDRFYWLTTNKSDILSLSTSIQVFDLATNRSRVVYNKNNINITGGPVTSRIAIHDLLVVKNHLYWEATISASTQLLRADTTGTTELPVEIYSAIEPEANSTFFTGGYLPPPPAYKSFLTPLLIDTNDY
jgi:hypothetical protein